MDERDLAGKAPVRYLSYAARRNKLRLAAAHKALMASPADAERNQLRDVVRGTNEQLAKRAHKYLTLADEYNERERYARQQQEPWTYLRWLTSVGFSGKDARTENARADAEWNNT